MAIAYDASSFFKGNSVTSDSWSHTCAGSDRILIVAIGSGDSPTQLTTSVTYNGVAMTEIADVQGGDYAHVSLHYLVAPATGANTIAFTLAGAQSEVCCVASSYTGVDQSVPVGTHQSAGGTSATAAAPAVSSAAGELVVDGVFGADTNLIAVGAGQTMRQEAEDSGNGFGAAGTSDEPGAASVTMSWAINTGLAASPSWAIIAVPLKPAGVGGGDPEGLLIGSKLLGRGLLGGVLT